MEIPIDLSSFVAAQILSQLDDATKEKLFVESIAKVLDSDKIQQLLKEEITTIAKQEVKRRMMEDLEMQSKIINLVNDAFARIFEQNQEELKEKLAKGIVESLIKDRY